MKKQASPSVKPVNQLGSGIPLKLIFGLGTATVLGKCDFKLFVKPRFKEAFKFIIFCKPLKLICSLHLIISIIFTNNSKSARF
jgi:hypothetical protein